MSNFAIAKKIKNEIKYYLKEASTVSFSLFDANGNLISNKPQEKVSAGEHSFLFNTKELKTGIYIVEVKTCKYAKSLKFNIENKF